MNYLTMEGMEVTERQLIIVTDQPDSADSSDNAETDAYLSVASSLLEELIEQMAWKDAPPSNDAATAEGMSSRPLSVANSRTLSRHGRTITSTHNKSSFSPSPKQMASPATLQGTSSFETADSSHDIMSFFQEYLRETPGGFTSFPNGHPISQYNKALEKQMNLPDRLGHTSLTALSNWTLSTLGARRMTPSPTIPLKIETYDVATPKDKSTLPTPRSRTRLWRNKKRSTPTNIAIQFNAAPASAFRLQMFGSEYARHLSTSALAPSADEVKQRRRHYMRKPWKLKSLSTVAENPVYLDDADPAYQTGALLDIVVTCGEQLPPTGFFRLGSANHPFKLERGKKNLYIDVKKEPSWDKAAQRPCITALTIIFPDRYEFVPPGFSIVRDGKPVRQDKLPSPEFKENAGNPADVGLCERAFLCFRRSREGNPITSLISLSPLAAESVPTGFTVLEKTPRNFVACIHDSPGQAIFFAFQQRLANLETLRPLPLLMSVLVGRTTTDSSRSRHEDEAPDTAKLEAYYATGGTVVPAQVGRFHIMDRTTHSLLSPSSIANRLSLIEQSRISAGKKGLSITESTDLMTTLSRTPSTCSRGEGWDRRFLQDGLSETQHSHTTDMSLPTEESPVGISSIFRGTLTSTKHEHPLSLSDHERASCSEALSFIPCIESVSGNMNSLDTLQTRCLILTPILTSCYNRHGGSAMVAVDGLFHLLTKTDFFGDDVELSDEGDDESCYRLTLLDLTIQVVCDVATSGAQETTFTSCAEFVETAVRYSQAQLNTRTIGYIIRFYLFVFYFGASVPCTNAQWPNPAWGAPPPSDEDAIGSSPSILYDPRESKGSKYLPGGAPQLAVLALKELISLCLVRLGKVSVSNMVLSIVQDSSSMSECGKAGDDIGSFLDRVLSSTVNDAVAHVERANLAQLALHQIHRSGGSELFWHDMVNACGMGLFGQDPKLTDAGRAVYTTTFALMANLTKIAFGKAKANSGIHETPPRDLASKMLSLELLLHFLEYWSDQQEAVSLMGVSGSASRKVPSTETLAFVVRRMIAPCLLSNTKIGMENPAVFSRSIRIVFELWKSPIYRRHCKAELGVLIEQFVIRLLQLGPQLLKSPEIDVWSDTAGQSLHFQQLSLLRELKRVFVVEPKQAVELFINYDTDFVSQETGGVQLLPGSQWKLFQKMSSALSAIAERCGEVIGRQIEEHRAEIHSSNIEELSSPKHEHNGPTSSSSKASMRESARSLRTASLEALSHIVRAVALSAGASVSPKFSGLFASWSSIDAPIVQEDISSVQEEESPYSNGTLSTYVTERPKEQPLQQVHDYVPRESKEKAIETAVDIARKKTLKKAVEYLIACSVLPPSPRDIATFLRVHRDKFDPSALGMYLGESGVGGAESEYWNAIRLSFVRPIPFVGMNVDQGLRHFLTHCGFKLPGEAQKIDRIINTFAQCYYEDNAGDLQVCPFRNEDSVYMLSFAIIMLNTDLHKAATASARRGRKRMSKADFIQNLKGVEHGEEIPRQYLSDIYDSIEENPIVLDEGASSISDMEDSNAVLQDILNHVRGAASLLHSLAVHDFKFATISDIVEACQLTREDALGQISRDMLSKTWHHWHSVISTCLETAHLDLQGMEPCVDILLYSLAATVCLNMKMESTAFLSQLGRLKSFEELRQGRWVHAPENETFHGEDWYVELEEACGGSEDRRIWALRNIHEWMESVQGALLEDVCNKAELTRAVSQLENGDSLLQDPARSFVRSGDLCKKSGRTGRAVAYRFFLFSDLLVYAKPEPSGKFKIHEELPIYQMKVVDWYPSTQKSRQRSFDIHHPRKNFQVICADANERKSWVNDIRSAITFEVERKMKLEAARLAVISKGF